MKLEKWQEHSCYCLGYLDKASTPLNLTLPKILIRKTSSEKKFWSATQNNFSTSHLKPLKKMQKSLTFFYLKASSYMFYKVLNMSLIKTWKMQSHVAF